MPYKVQNLSSFRRDAKSFSKNKAAIEALLAHIEAIIADPMTGEAMIGNLKGIYKFKFGSKPQYRLLYRVYKCCHKPGQDNECLVDDDEVEQSACEGVISFVYLKTREECNNLYNKGKKYFEDTKIEGLSTV